jgi:hypothetical protein
MDEKSDAEALRDWESEGGAPSPSLYDDSSAAIKLAAGFLH